MKNRFAINEFTFQIAQDAMRDILFMYWDLENSYGGFGHGVETGRFNQYLCVDSLVEDQGYSKNVDIELIHNGSAVKILCFLSDHVDEHAASPGSSSWLQTRLSDLVSSRRLDHLPLAKAAISSGLKKAPDFDDRLKAVYQEYVVQWLAEHWRVGR